MKIPIPGLITTPLSPPSQGGDFVVMVRQVFGVSSVERLSKDQSNDEGEVFHRLFTILVMDTKPACLRAETHRQA